MEKECREYAKHVAAEIEAIYNGTTEEENDDGEKMTELVDLRIGATASTAYACVWFKGEKKWAYGSGKAGGYGYDKGSAAAEAAFRAAGMVTSGFGGTGCNREAVKAAGEYLSDGKPVFVVEFYG